MIVLDWSAEKPFATLEAEEGRSVEIRLLPDQSMDCATCGHRLAKHDYLGGADETPCTVAGCECQIHVWKRFEKPASRTEVRFFGLARIKNGTGSAAARRRWNRNPTPREGHTVARIRLYSTTFGGLVRLASLGLPLRLVPTKKEHKAHGATITGAELAKLSIALEEAIGRGEWLPDEGFRVTSAQDELHL